MEEYVLVTSARNEEEYIEKTILSVTNQTRPPKKWVIVDDSSNDSTPEIVEKYANNFRYIKLIKFSGDKNRNFGSKARAVNYGYNSLKGQDFDFIGNLDADISFDSNYYQQLINKFNCNPRLGLAGGIRYDKDGNKFRKVSSAQDSVGGPIQFFRREVFESINGYTPSIYGGIDAVAELMVRMKGWRVETFPDIEVLHHRKTGTGSGSILKTYFRHGLRSRSHGHHPCYEIVRLIYRFNDRPFVIASLLRALGFFWGNLRGYPIALQEDVVAYLRREQLGKLKGRLFGRHVGI